MKILELPVNKFYFEQVNNQELEEDYREIKEYWIRRLIKAKYQKKTPLEIVELYNNNVDIFTSYDKVLFKNGYSDKSPKKLVSFKSIRLTNSTEMTCMGRGIAFAIKIKY